MEIKLNGETITSQICEQEIRRLRTEESGLSEKEVKTRARENLIRQNLIRQNAAINNIEVPKEDVQAELRKLKQAYGGEKQFYQRFRLSTLDDRGIKLDLEQRLIMDRFLEDLAAKAPEPDSESIRDYYEKNMDKMVAPEQIHASHIVKPVDPKNRDAVYQNMCALRRKLLDGTAFEDLADAHSSCEDEGGDLGFFSPGKLVEEFDAVAFSMDPGEISPVFLTKFGYHIAKVWEKKPSKEKTFDEARDDIRDSLYAESKTRYTDDWLARKTERAVIELVD